MRSRSSRFDELVLDSVDHLEHRLHRPLASLEFAVEDVPPSDPAPWEAQIALGRAFPATRTTAARIVLYRRPIESRALHEADLCVLIDDVVAEQVASVLGIHPDDLED
ncbi:metallopeptidase family protein [Leekyejoonella antrihumi]|uniref:Metallopeptidase family protein n=2 Tax=Leekyejoonella antrihumi TaxID=1660198 RepID=A0A563DZS0_9MICO|nr:metallopeptidase family protein [Leekyejoonella antrihumi]